MAVTFSLSKSWETKILKLIGKGEAPAAPETYLALYTTTPTRVAAGTEAVYTGYKRLKVAHEKWTLVEATGAAENEEGYIKNSEEIKFPECTAGESKVKGAALVTAESAGEQVAWCEIPEVIINTVNSIAYIPAAALKFKVS